jgi:hypothetical protein
MAEAVDLVNAINAELQTLWRTHSLNIGASAELQAFKSDMVETLIQARNDPDGFLASRRSMRRHAAQEPEPPQQHQASHVQQPDAADIYARRAAAMGR